MTLYSKGWENLLLKLTLATQIKAAKMPNTVKNGTKIGQTVKMHILQNFTYKHKFNKSHDFITACNFSQIVHFEVSCIQLRGNYYSDFGDFYEFHIHVSALIN